MDGSARTVKKVAARRSRRPKAVGTTPAIEVAAVDLGSNSFHMLVARENDGQLQVLDRLREAVRLAAGLGADRKLTRDAEARALACLERFGQRLRTLPPSRVRVVGTNTLRRLQDGGAFVAAAEKALGHEIGIISGVEEARLVYNGVTHGMDTRKHARPRRLVVDIGGGSTELIIGRGAEAQLMESVPLGCVVHTQRFFADGEISRARMREARLAARVEIEFLEHRYRRAGWDLALGASGTVRGAWRVMKGQGWSDELITREALEKTLELTIRTGKVERIDFPGLREDRRPVFAGGIAVLAGIFDGLGIEQMETSDRALREGLIYDLLGRLSDRDVRNRSVEQMADRYGIDRQHALAVERTVLKLLDQVVTGWQLDRRIATTLLRWAARLQEIGLIVAHDGSHRHGEYILRNADLFGFSLTDQTMLAALVRLQRGKFANGVIEDVPEAWRALVRKLAVLFRLAIVLHRARTPGLRVPLKISVDARNVKLEFRAGWLDRHPLTREDLELEAQYLEPAGIRLRVV